MNKNRLQAKKAEAPSKCHSREWARYTVGPHAAAAIINGGSTTVVECASSEWLPAQFQRYFWQSYSPTEEVAPIGSPPQGARPWASTVGSATDLEHRSSAPLGFLVSTLVRLRQLGCHHRVRNHAPPIVCRNDTSYYEECISWFAVTEFAAMAAAGESIIGLQYNSSASCGSHAASMWRCTN